MSCLVLRGVSTNQYFNSSQRGSVFGHFQREQVYTWCLLTAGRFSLDFVVVLHAIVSTRGICYGRSNELSFIIDVAIYLRSRYSTIYTVSLPVLPSVARRLGTQTLQPPYRCPWEGILFSTIYISTRPAFIRFRHISAWLTVERHRILVTLGKIYITLQVTCIRLHGRSNRRDTNEDFVPRHLSQSGTWYILDFGDIMRNRIAACALARVCCDRDVPSKMKHSGACPWKRGL